MKKFRKLLILSFVLTLLLGNLTVRVSAEDTTVPTQDETTVTTTDYSTEDYSQAEDEAEKRAREQQEALNAAVEEARRKAAEQTQQYQQEIDTQTYQSNDNVWQAIDEVIEPEDGRKKITTTTNSEAVKKEDTDKEETVTDKVVKKEVAANVDLGGGSSIFVTTKYGSLSDNTVLSVTELGDSALIEFANRVGLANVVDGRYFVVNLLDENGESVTASRPLTISLNSVDVNGELVNIYAANSETYELYAEGLTNTGVVDYTFETKDYDTFVILATGTAVEETAEPQATGFRSILQNIPFLAIFNKTEETETLSGRTETSFTNDFVLNETEVETEGYPAFKATKTISGTSMEVVVDAPAGAFPEGIQLYAEVVTTPQEVLQAIKDETGAEAEQTLTLDIHFYLEENPDKEIEPNVPISVTFNNIAVESETVDVYHETEKIDTVNTDSATLELDGFSNYTFVLKAGGPLLANGDPTNDPAGDPAANNAERYESIPVAIVWDDDNNRDGKRPRTLYLRLYRGDTYVRQQGVTTAENSSNITFTENATKPDLTFDKYDSDGTTLLEYTVYTSTTGSGERVPLENYNVEVTGDAANGFTVTLTHTPEIINQITIKKVWDDADNRDGLRKNYVFTISGTVEGVSEPIITRTLEASPTNTEYPVGKGYMDGVLVPFYKYHEGKKINYTVTENPIEGYTPVVSDMDENGVVTITNTHEPKVLTVEVTKEWADENNVDSIRPEIIYVHAFRQLAGVEEYVGYFTLTVDNEWNTSADKLQDTPLYVNAPVEQEYEYVFTESTESTAPQSSSVSKPPIGYTVGIVTTPSEDGSKINVEVKNTHEPYLRNITVTKKWEKDEADTSHRQDVEVELLADGKSLDPQVKLNLNEMNGWTDTVNNLPKNKPNPDGTETGVEIQYTVKEIEIPFYVSKITGDMENGFTVTNIFIPNTTTVTINKVWEDENDPDRPDVAHVLLMNNGKVEREARLREDTGWTATFTDIPVYDSSHPDSLIDYKVEEDNNVGYKVIVEKEGNPVDGYTFTVTNIRQDIDLYHVDVNVSVNWNDGDNADGLRAPVIVTLLADDKPAVDEEGKPITLELNRENGYTGVFEKLPKYDLEASTGSIFATNRFFALPNTGKVIKYTVTTDTTITGYKGPEITPDGDNSFLITYTHAPERVNIQIEKVWMDEDSASTDGGNNRDGIRPNEITYVIFADGEEVHRATAEAGEDGEFTVIQYEDNKKRDGQKINYTVVEEYVDNYVATYETTVIPPATEDDIETQLWTVTNTYDPEKRTITVMKNWDDNDNQDGQRPKFVMVYLYADGEPVLDEWDEEVYAELNAENGWAYNFVVFKNKNEDGVVTPIEYTVEELPVDGYDDPVYSDYANTGYITITNKHTPDTEIVVLIKEWDDQDNKDGSRPESIIFNVEGYIIDLEQTGARIHIPYDQSIIMMQDSMDNPNVWRKSIELEKYYNGQPITYFLTEEAVEGYTPDVHEVTIIAEDGTVVEEATITNTHTPEPVVIEGNVIWNDSNDQDGNRPSEVTVNLYADGEKVDSKTVTGDSNTWSYTFEDLPKYSRGQVINYTVSETPIDDYSMRVQGYDITNSYTPGKTFLTVIKLWDDDRDRDGYRPDNCIVRLLADGEEVNRASLSEGQGWFTVFSDLPKMKDGKEITYTVEEDDIPEYKKEFTGDQKEGYVIKNTHEPEKIDVVMKVRWFDDNNKLCKRPEKVKAHLLANGQGVVTKIFYAGEDWEDIVIKDLPKKAYGKEILYTISQKPLKNYETSNIGTTAYNKLEGCCKLCSGSECTSECKPALPKTGVDATTVYHNPNYLLLAK